MQQQTSNLLSQTGSLQCLTCRQADRLIRVPALVSEGRVVNAIQGRVSGPYGPPAPVRGRVVRVDPLADALAAPRGPRNTKWPAVAVGVFGIFSALNLFTVITPTNPSGIAGVLVTGLATGWSWRQVCKRRRAVREAGPLAERARWLWWRCWYCRRCGVVSLMTPNGSTTLPADNLAAGLFDMASRLHWHSVR